MCVYGMLTGISISLSPTDRVCLGDNGQGTTSTDATGSSMTSGTMRTGTTMGTGTMAAGTFAYDTTARTGVAASRRAG